MGYLKLSSFTYNTSADFDAALQELGDVHTLVLDLCDNRGGLIASAIDVVGHFLKKNSVICSLKSNSRTRHYRSKGATFEGRVIVMVNGGSASASELVAAALQDWDRGVVVGRTTFGKGIGQHNFRFDDGSALHLTTMKVLSPSGRSIQRPFELGASEEYFLGMLSRVSNNRQNEVDTLSLPKFFTLNSSRTVYGNSGVHPDIFVKASVGSLLGLFFDVVLVDMLDKYRTTIVSRYPRCSDFIADFSFDASDIALFGGDDAEDNEQRGELLKMRMAFNIYPAEQYYPIYNLMLNDIYREALAVANSPQMVDNILSGNN